MALAPGVVRDFILEYLRGVKEDATVKEIQAAVERKVGGAVPRSSVRSYLANNTPNTFVRTAPARYRLRRAAK